MGIFEGKKILIFGVANQRSIAWSIANALQKEGAELAFTYLNEALEKRVRPLAESIGCKSVYPCDVQSDEDLDRLFDALEENWGTIDGVLHSIAYADKRDLEDRFSRLSRAGFRTAMDISAYSLVAIAGRAHRLMKNNGGTILALSYLGSQRVVSNYNVMGVAKAALEASVRYLAADLGADNIRVNAISAGPIKTLAASGIPHFKKLMSDFAERAPLRRNVDLEDVATSGLYFLGPHSKGVTGEVSYVDCGFNIMAL